ncbi:SCO7460 family lipoprotein [Streptomyces sp. NPDC058200]|uniref:SCO7460 family lipoprotein n=1 Tax=Streptomyces sp. NPDC058200 TaxID=3346378 RepID=UPI0036E3DD55
MAGSRGGRLRGGLTGAMVCSLALLLGGCGVLSTKNDRKRAAELAERQYPGVLDVVSARTLFPQTGGSEVSFSVADDADAVVRLRIDAAAGTCGQRACDRALDEAVRRGRSEAGALRRMRSAFTACGYEAIALSQDLATPWIAAAPTNATITRLLAEVGACVRRWSPARDETGTPSAARSVTVNIVAPDLARGRPAGKPSWPTAMRMTDGKLLAALSERPYYSATYTVRDGTVDAASGTASVFRPWAYQRAFATTVQDAVGGWLHASDPRAEVRTYQGFWRLEPGTVDRFRGYVLFCDHPRGERPCLGDHAVAVTTDPKGNPIGEFRMIRDVREDGGRIRLPPE